MGCDIHMCLEIKKSIDKEEKWICGDLYIKNPYYGVFEDEKEFERVSVYDGRNYSLFAILADVRNYGKNEPISKPRGIPDDCCKETLEEYGCWEDDAHSASYFTLKELIDYDEKAITTKFSGMISGGAAKELDENGVHPSSWCQMTNREGWVYREWEERTTYISTLISLIKERANIFYQREPEEIRIVFWFDN